MKIRNPDSTPRKVARLLRALAALVEASSLDEATSLLEAQTPRPKARRRNVSNVPEEANLPLDFSPQRPPDLPKLAETLQGLRSRDEGISLLTSISMTRKELEGLGRLLGTPILRTDNMDRLLEKIIEASIGSRLTSEAIRGDRQS